MGRLTYTQHGSRAGKDIATAQVEKRLLCDYSRLLRVPMVYIFVDGVSCYDRIVAAMGLLICEKYGLHKKVSDLVLQILQGFQYKTLTTYEIRFSYGNTPDIP